MDISIFTPTHNDLFLKEAYDSIKNQDFFEWIVLLNNGAKYNNSDPRVKIYYDNSNLNYVGYLKRKCCQYAKGDILLELDHDDLLMSNAIEEVKLAFADPKVGFVYSNPIYSTKDFNKTPRFSESFQWQYREINFNGHTLDEYIAFPPTPEAISRIYFAPNHLRAFRREIYESIDGYRSDMKILDDLDLMCRFYLNTKFKHIDKGLYIYRVHGQNTWLRYSDQIQIKGTEIYDRYIELLVMKLDGLKIDLGARRFITPYGFKTVNLKDADIIADLNNRWPFEDNSVAVIRAYDIFEHLKNSIHTFKECYRILKPGGWIIGQVPSTDGRGAFQDPTHVSFFNENSFLYYTNQNWAQFIDTPVRFQSSKMLTTEKDEKQVCWTKFHLISLKDGYHPPGLIEI